MKIVKHTKDTRINLPRIVNQFNKHKQFLRSDVLRLRSLNMKSEKITPAFSCRVSSDILEKMSEKRYEDFSVGIHCALILTYREWSYPFLRLTRYRGLERDTLGVYEKSYMCKIRTDWQTHRHSIVFKTLKEKRVMMEPYKKRSILRKINSIEVEGVNDIHALAHLCESVNARITPLFWDYPGEQKLKNIAKHMFEVTPPGIDHVHGKYIYRLEDVIGRNKETKDVKDVVERSPKSMLGVTSYRREDHNVLHPSVFVPYDEEYSVVHLTTPLTGYVAQYIGGKGRDWLNHQNTFQHKMIFMESLKNLIENCSKINEIWKGLKIYL